MRSRRPLRTLVLENLGSLGRRDFVRLGAAMAALTACKSRSYEPVSGVRESEGGMPTFERVGGGKKVVVIGAGLSGLASAYELMNAGFDVTVLEWQKRVSGRVWTQRNHFENGQYAELGATRIPSHHNLTHGYAKLLGLEVEPLPETDMKAVYVINGKRWVWSGAADSGPALPANDSWSLNDDERSNGIGWIKSHYTQLAFADLGDPRSPDWPSAEVQQKYDSMTFGQYLRSKGASETAMKILLANNGSEVEMFSALAWLGLEVLDAAWDTTGKIKGGNDQIAGRFAEKLGDRVKLNAKVKTVRQDASGVTVVTDRAGEFKGDYVLCTIAPVLLPNVAWEPGLSEMKLEGAGKVLMQPVMRVNLQFKTRFWYDAEKLRGLTIAHTDLPIERLWDMSATQSGTNGILTSYIMSERARTATVPVNERTEYVMKHVETFFPQAREQLVKSSTWAWHEQEWVKGGWLALRPGEFDYYKAFKKPEGRAFFAGDHTTLGAGWMQGAFESAHRVVDEIIAAAKLSNEAKAS